MARWKWLPALGLFGMLFILSRVAVILTTSKTAVKNHVILQEDPQKENLDYLDPPLANRVIHVLHVSTPHPGVMMEVENIVYRLNSKRLAQRWDLKWMCSSCHLDIMRDFSAITKEEADFIWNKTTRQMCNDFDVILVSDTIAQARSFLQNECHHRIVLRITNRFDWQLWDDPTFYSLMNRTAATRNSLDKMDIAVVPNNHFEVWYASRFRSVHFQSWIVLPGVTLDRSLPMLKEVSKEVSKETSPVSSLSNLRNHNFYVVLSHHDRFILQPILDEKKIPYVALEPRRYGGSHAIQNQVLVHLPYQASTMALWENLGAGVVYFLPSKKLFREEVLPRRICCLLPKDFEEDVNQDFISYMDWYHESYQSLFLYFDTWIELKTLLVDHHDEILAKRKIIRKWMDQHDIEALSYWQRILDPINKAQSR